MSLSLCVSFVASNSVFPSLHATLCFHRSSDHYSSDHHSSSQAFHLQCQPLYCPSSGPHITPNRIHQQAAWSSTNHSHCACHPPATPPSSRPRAPCLWGKAGPWCPVAHHTERRNSRPPVSQRISRWVHLHVYIFKRVYFLTPWKKQHMFPVEMYSLTHSVCPPCMWVFVCAIYLYAYAQVISMFVLSRLFFSTVVFFCPCVGPTSRHSPVGLADESLSSTNERLISHRNRADWKWRIMKWKARQQRLHLPSC